MLNAVQGRAKCVFIEYRSTALIQSTAQTFQAVAVVRSRYASFQTVTHLKSPSVFPLLSAHEP